MAISSVLVDPLTQVTYPSLTFYTKLLAGDQIVPPVGVAGNPTQSQPIQGELLLNNMVIRFSPSLQQLYVISVCECMYVCVCVCLCV